MVETVQQPTFPDFNELLKGESAGVRALPYAIGLVRRLAKSAGYTVDDPSLRAVAVGLDPEHTGVEKWHRNMVLLQGKQLVELIWRSYFPDRVGINSIIQDINGPTSAELWRRPDVRPIIESLLKPEPRLESEGLPSRDEGVGLNN